MPLQPPSIDELFTKFRRAMEEIGFSHWEEGSRIGAIGLAFCAYIVDLWNTLKDLDDQGNLSTARGIYLDRIGAQYGVFRHPPSAATTLGRGLAVKFTNNGLTQVTIPAGTRIWNPDDPDIAFFTHQDIVLNAGAEGFADVTAGSVGDNHNVAAGTLTAHNAGMGQVSVTNVRPIGGGAFFESDDSYRFRISQALQARHGSTELAIRSALLAIPGIRDVFVHPGVRGPGSVDVVVVPIDRFASQALMDAAEQAVADTVAAGISVRVLEPITRRVDVHVQLRLIGGTTVDDVRSAVEAAIRGYIDNLRVNDGGGGSDLIYNELVSRVMDADPNILDSSIDLIVDGQPTLQTSVTTSPGERLVSGFVRVI